MAVEGQTCLQTSASGNGSHAGGWTLCTCQAFAIQERVLCGHQSTEQALWGLRSMGLADARNPAHTGPMSPKCLTFSALYLCIFF